MRAFFDIDTQIDFLYPAGALYGQGSERIIAPVATLNHYAARSGIPLFSTTCAHGENSREFRDWPAHCVKGTIGQQKPAATLLPNRIIIPNEPASVDVTGAQQIIIEKDEMDLFSNPNVPALLDSAGVGECFVYGAFTDFCVKCAIHSLLKAGRRVSVVKDATAHLAHEAGEKVLAYLVSAGGSLVSMSDAMH
jgi:nicotinamidase/pyrazinamidase